MFLWFSPLLPVYITFLSTFDGKYCVDCWLFLAYILHLRIVPCKLRFLIFLLFNCVPTISAHTVTTQNKIPLLRRFSKCKNFSQSCCPLIEGTEGYVRGFISLYYYYYCCCCYFGFLLLYIVLAHIIFSFSSNILDFFP